MGASVSLRLSSSTQNGIEPFELGKLRVIFSVLSRRLCFRHCFRPIHSDIEIFQHVLLSPPPGSFQYAMFYDSAYASKTDEFIDFVYMSGTHKRREISTAKVVAEWSLSS